MRSTHPVVSKKSDAIKQICAIQSPWTELLLAVVTRYIGDEDLYKDSMEENWAIVKSLSESNRTIDKTNLFSHAKKRDDMREQYQNEIAEYNIVIAQLENDYMEKQKIERQTAPIIDAQIPKISAELKEYSKAISAIKDERMNVVKRFKKLNVKLKDIEYLRQSLHYATSTSGRDKAGIKANQVLDSLHKHDLSFSNNTVRPMNRLFEDINSIAGIRERLFYKPPGKINYKQYREFYNEQTTKNSTQQDINLAKTYKRKPHLCLEAFRQKKIDEAKENLPNDLAFERFRNRLINSSAISKAESERYKSDFDLCANLFMEEQIKEEVEAMFEVYSSECVTQALTFCDQFLKILEQKLKQKRASGNAFIEKANKEIDNPYLKKDKKSDLDATYCNHINQVEKLKQMILDVKRAKVAAKDEMKILKNHERALKAEEKASRVFRY